MQDSTNFKLKQYKYSDAQFKKDLGFSSKKYDNIDYDIKMYNVNGWDIVSGHIFKCNESSSLRNNLHNSVEERLLPLGSSMNSTVYK